MMNDNEMSSLCESIKKNGLLHPIVSKKGVLLDGRNRMKACEILGMQPIYTEFEGENESEWIIATNKDRRHLNSSQLAALAVDLLPILEQEAKERQGARTDISANLRGSEEGKASQKAAKITGSSSRNVEQAKAIKNESPELFQKIREGDMTVNEAKTILRKEVQKEKNKEITLMNKALPEKDKRYSVIYADPPWRYDYSVSTARDIENQYPTMELSDIKKMQVPADNNCVLFLWATSPKLLEAMEVMSSWGFTYKTCMVWDKEKIGMGYYFRQQHELLLIGTIGTPSVPEPSVRPSSVLREKREGHSEKPKIMYEMIKAMYPDSFRIELFARNTHEGFDSWGNQV